MTAGYAGPQGRPRASASTSSEPAQQPPPPGRTPGRADPAEGEDGAVGTAAYTGPEQLVEWAGEEWVVRRITGSASTKPYRCPGCDQEIRPATPHVVAWPARDRPRPRGPPALAHRLLVGPRASPAALAGRLAWTGGGLAGSDRRPGWSTTAGSRTCSRCCCSSRSPRPRSSSASCCRARPRWCSAAPCARPGSSRWRCSCRWRSSPRSLGDSVGYEVGKHFGPRIRTSRMGRRIGDRRWGMAEWFFAQHGGKAVFLGRAAGAAASARPRAGRQQRAAVPHVPAVERPRRPRLGRRGRAARLRLRALAASGWRRGLKYWGIGVLALIVVARGPAGARRTPGRASGRGRVRGEHRAGRRRGRMSTPDPVEHGAPGRGASRCGCARRGRPDASSASWPCRWTATRSPPSSACTRCPTAGGMMDSHVLRKASWRLPALAGLAVLRFNTRGTGLGGRHLGGRVRRR